METNQLNRQEIADWLFTAGISQGYTLPVYFFTDNDGNFSVETETDMGAMRLTTQEIGQVQHIIPCDYFLIREANFKAILINGIV